MKQLLFIASILLSLFLCKPLFASAVSDTTQVLPIADKMPSFPGGDSLLFAFINKNIQYPEQARTAGISGTVYTRFTVTRTGQIKDAEIAKSVHPELDKEVLRILSLMPKWVPGEQNGQTVHVKYVLPVKFSIKEAKPAPDNAVSPDQEELLYMKDPKNPDNKIFITSQRLPQYPNGDQKMYDFLSLRVTSQTNMHQGAVHIKMIVRKDGSLTDFKVLKSTDPSFEGDV
ncbi:MAG: energy transducer TonB, partial [Hymenobacteraceae bacterium]|nr:energy transducer TonB [Hymenobacteraceae bacterium]MDX5396143.1 energy transducer TonB [Hymenobacteraceae bacterium]MDX5442290.1 energy transducer TonB [Hymenobacteraceae bacterium]MDX5512204.1 energy transducer TonB [Hymenobacteraceae bacterium]